MTQKQKIRWLGRYRQAVSRWDCLNAELEMSMSRAIRTTQYMSGMPGGGGGPTRADTWAAAAEEYNQALCEGIRGALRAMQEVLEVLDRVENPDYRKALEYTYINGYKQAVAAAMMGYGERHFRRLLLAALDAVVIIEPNDGV